MTKYDCKTNLVNCQLLAQNSLNTRFLTIQSKTKLFCTCEIIITVEIKVWVLYNVEEKKVMIIRFNLVSVASF